MSDTCCCVVSHPNSQWLKRHTLLWQGNPVWLKQNTRVSGSLPLRGCSQCWLVPQPLWKARPGKKALSSHTWLWIGLCSSQAGRRPQAPCWLLPGTSVSSFQVGPSAGQHLTALRVRGRKQVRDREASKTASSPSLLPHSFLQNWSSRSASHARRGGHQRGKRRGQQRPSAYHRDSSLFSGSVVPSSATPWTLAHQASLPFNS